MAKNRDALIDMMGTLNKFLDDRWLELNREKTKIVVFNKKKIRKEKRSGYGKGKKLKR